MLAALLIAWQVVALQPGTPDGVHHVDLLVVNQAIYSRTRSDGTTDWQTRFWTSYWDIYHFPPWGACRFPVMQHRGWDNSLPLVRCTGGWCHQRGDTAVVAPVVLFVVTGYDFEYKNRQWRRWK